MLTENENKILEIIRDLKPYEIVEIRKDKDGKADCYIIKREQKIILTRSYPQIT